MRKLTTEFDDCRMCPYLQDYGIAHPGMKDVIRRYGCLPLILLYRAGAKLEGTPFIEVPTSGIDKLGYWKPHPDCPLEEVVEKGERS